MRAWHLPLLAAATVGLVSCGASSAAGAASGIAGTVRIGPTCPVQRPGSVCTRPYATTLLVLTASHPRTLARVHSSRTGQFLVSLPPGRYEVRSSRPGPPWLRPIYVVVPRNGYARVRIEFDSGIR